MATLYIMIGIPGSGKSTYARKLADKLHCNVHSSDDIRVELFGNRQNLSNDKLVWKTINERMKADLESGKDCIVDATNVSVKKRSTYLSFIEGVSCKKVAVMMKTSFKDSVDRNDKRPTEQVVPYKAICNMQRAFQKPSLDEGFDEIRYI